MINELKLGNFVYFNGNQKEIGEITAIEYYIICPEQSYVKLNHRIDKKYPLGEINPIPLTEEMLLKCGFEIKEGRFGNEYHLGHFVLYTSEKGNICFLFENLAKDFYFLHEIQNLYFIFFNQGLQITL